MSIVVIKKCISFLSLHRRFINYVHNTYTLSFVVLGMYVLAVLIFFNSFIFYITVHVKFVLPLTCPNIGFNYCNTPTQYISASFTSCKRDKKQVNEYSSLFSRAFLVSSGLCSRKTSHRSTRCISQIRFNEIRLLINCIQVLCYQVLTFILFLTVRKLTYAKEIFHQYVQQRSTSLQ